MDYYIRFSRLTVLLALVMTCFSVQTFTADTEGAGKLDQYQDELEERDWDALREYLRSRREEEKDQSKSALLLSGDARADWRNKHEVLKDNNLLGHNVTDSKGIRRGRNKFDIEVNLRLDYDLDKSWAVIQLQYYNKAGIDDETNCVDNNAFGEKICYCREMFGSGECGELCLKQAFFGYNVYKCGDTEFDIEVGRRYLYYIFDSKVQFLSRFDGILFSLGGTVKNVMDYYVHSGAFVVDFKVNHFAYITELGALNLYDTGLDLKYSIIDWRKKGHNRCSEKISGCTAVAQCDEDDFKCGDRYPPGTKYLISQWTANYELKKGATCIDKDMRFFGAFLINHANPDKNCFPNKQNKAWYAGYRIGDVKKAGNWSFAAMYQWVEAFSVPDLDMSGIGNGNTYDDLLLTDGLGNTNFKGWRFDGLYAFTDEITINARYEFSNEICKNLYNGKNHYFRQIKVEMMYSF